MDLSALQTLIGGPSGHAMFLLIAVIEGPVATILAAALAQKGLLDLHWVLPLAILGDVLGDVILYLTGRFAAGLLPRRMCHRLGLDRHVIAPLVTRFHQRGGRILVLAKLTHVAGVPVLFAAGVARMALPRFVLVSLLATLPKVIVLCAVGWVFGGAVAGLHPPVWLTVAGVVLAGLCLCLCPILCKTGFRWI